MSIASLCDVDNYQKVITWVEFLVFFSSEKYCFGEIFYQKANSYSEFFGGLTAVEIFYQKDGFCSEFLVV